MLSNVAHWTTHADGKTGILAASVVVIVAGVSTQVAGIAAVLADEELQGWMALAIVAWLASAVGVSWNVDRALRPQTTGGNGDNPYSWPDLALGRGSRVASSNREELALLDEQLSRLSRIAHAKFRHFKIALTFGWLFLGVSLGIVAFLVLHGVGQVAN